MKSELNVDVKVFWKNTTRPKKGGDFFKNPKGLTFTYTMKRTIFAFIFLFFGEVSLPIHYNIFKIDSWTGLKDDETKRGGMSRGTCMLVTHKR